MLIVRKKIETILQTFCTEMYLQNTCRIFNLFSSEYAVKCFAIYIFTLTCSLRCVYEINESENAIRMNMYFWNIYWYPVKIVFHEYMINISNVFLMYFNLLHILFIYIFTYNLPVDFVIGCRYLNHCRLPQRNH